MNLFQYLLIKHSSLINFQIRKFVQNFVLRCLYKHNLKYRYINETIVIMSDGGFSNSGFQALIQKNYESIKSLKKNNIKFNPLNLISKFFYRLKEINRAKKYSIKNG